MRVSRASACWSRPPRSSNRARSCSRRGLAARGLASTHVNGMPAVGLLAAGGRRANAAGLKQKPAESRLGGVERDELQQRRGTAASPTCDCAPAMPYRQPRRLRPLLLRRQTGRQIRGSCGGLQAAASGSSGSWVLAAAKARCCISIDEEAGCRLGLSGACRRLRVSRTLPWRARSRVWASRRSPRPRLTHVQRRETA